MALSANILSVCARSCPTRVASKAQRLDTTCTAGYYQAGLGLTVILPVCELTSNVMPEPYYLRHETCVADEGQQGYKLLARTIVNLPNDDCQRLNQPSDCARLGSGAYLPR